MNRFGELLTGARNKLGFSQQKVADLVAAILGQESETDVKQFTINKLEAGTTKWPVQNVLVALTQVLNLPYDLTVTTLMKDRYGLEDPEFFQSTAKRIFSLPEVALWESSECHKETWVVVREFTDERRNEFREAVKSILINGNKIAFFMAAGLEDRIGLYRDQLSAENGRPVTLDDLRYVPLTTAQRAFLVSPFVLASKTTLSGGDVTEPQGYQFLTDDLGEPCAAIQLSTFEACERHIAMRVFVSQLKLVA